MNGPREQTVGWTEFPWALGVLFEGLFLSDVGVVVLG